MSEGQELLKDRFAQLPPELQRAILSVDLREKLKRITETRGLHIDQAGALENETVFVMLGLEPIEDYAENLRRELSIGADAAAAIVRDVNKEIFLPIREAMKQIGQEVARETTVETPRPPLERTAPQKPIAPVPFAAPAPRVGWQPPAASSLPALSTTPRTPLGVEKPEPENGPPKDFFAEKLSADVATPRGEIALGRPAPEIKRPTPDPYREPVE